MNRSTARIVLAVSILLASFLMPGRSLHAQSLAAPSGVDWLEPNGLNIVDLVGYVPDADLQGAILYGSTGYGIIRYVSGSRSANSVTIHAQVYPRWYKETSGRIWTQFGCLGDAPFYDTWGTVAPSGYMRFYSNGADVTGQVGWIATVAAGQIKPSYNAGSPQYSRYPLILPQSATYSSGGWLIVPANRGCQIAVPAQLNNMTADFLFDVSPSVDVHVTGRQTLQFHSLVGLGDGAWINSLVQQMAGFGSRHEKPALSPPTGSEYAFVNVPPMPIDVYAVQPELGMNVAQPSFGTYRLVGPSGELSVDHVISAGLPLGDQWRDADQSAGDYLAHYANAGALAGPEYFVPPGIPYQECMHSGNCPDTLLHQIYDTQFPVSVTYLTVTRIVNGLTRVPLRQVGKSWQPGAYSQQLAPPINHGVLNFHIFMPRVLGGIKLPPDDPTGCPCGWFTPDGRMVDFIPGP